MQVILATGDEKLDEWLMEHAEEGRFSIAETVYYKEALSDIIRRKQADVVLLSVYLPGSHDLGDCLLQLRMADLRVVLLAGDLDRNDPLIHEAISLGIYDILFNKPKLLSSNLLKAIIQPGSFSQAIKACRIPGKPKPKRRFWDTLKEYMSRVPEEPTESTIETQSPEDIVLPAEGSVVTECIGEEVGPPKKKRKKNMVKSEDNGGSEQSYLRPNKPTIAIWSPVSTGKTCVSVYLARALAKKGIPIALVDLDLSKQSIFHWLVLHEGEYGLNKALSPGVVLGLEVEGVHRDGIQVFSRDPRSVAPEVDSNALIRFCNAGKLNAEIVIFDLPSTLSDWGKELLSLVHVVVIVGDQDYSHCVEVKAALDKMRPDTLLVLNKFSDVKGWLTKDAYGKDAIATIPCLTSEIYTAIAQGKLSPDITEAVQPLADVVLEHMKPSQARKQRQAKVPARINTGLFSEPNGK